MVVAIVLAILLTIVAAIVLTIGTAIAIVMTIVIANRDHACEILGIQRKFTSDMLRKAYLRQALKYHPDKPGGNKEKFQEIRQAFDYLNDTDEKDINKDSSFKIESILKKCIGFFSPETDLDDKFINTCWSTKPYITPLM